MTFFSGKPANEQLFAIMKKATAEAKANGLTPEQTETDIIHFLNDLRQEMAEKGLTQEILDELLKDES